MIDDVEDSQQSIKIAEQSQTNMDISADFATQNNLVTDNGDKSIIINQSHSQMVVKDQEKEVKSSSVSSDSEEDRKVNSMDLGNKMKEGGEKEAPIKLGNEKGDLKRSRFSMSAGKMVSIIDTEMFEVNAKTKDGDDKPPPLVNTKKLLKLRKDQEKFEAQSN